MNADIDELLRETDEAAPRTGTPVIMQTAEARFLSVRGGSDVGSVEAAMRRASSLASRSSGSAFLKAEGALQRL